MPADRIQLLEERVDALTEALVAEGALPREWAESVEATEQIGEGNEIAEAAREGRGPPSFAGGSNGRGNNGSNGRGNNGNSGNNGNNGN